MNKIVLTGNITKDLEIKKKWRYGCIKIQYSC